MSQPQAGFSLLELLIVLAILAGIGVVSGPPLARTYDRITFAMAREDVERAIGDLPNRARRSGRSLILADLPKGSDGDSVAVALPGNWSLKVKHPILYRFDGLCLGGELSIQAGSQSYDYVLAGPFCRPVLKS